MRIGIEINGVLRDTLKKIQQEYEKWYLDNPFKEDEEKSEYEVISDLTSLDIRSHLKFKDDDELINPELLPSPQSIFKFGVKAP